MVLADDEGRFSAFVRPGLIEIVALAEGFASVTRRAFAPESAIQIALSPGSEIAGRVVDENQQPIAGLSVSALMRAELEQKRPAVAPSDAAGEFRIGGVIGGSWYDVWAVGDSWASDRRRVFVDVGRTSMEVELHARAATSLSGKVQRAGSPCVDADIAVSGPVFRSARTDSTGEVHLTGLVPGQYRVSIHCPKSTPFVEWIDLDLAPSHRIWSVEQGLGIHGKVVTQRGQPVAGALVVIVAVDSMLAAGTTCLSSETGEFECVGLRAGRYDCSVNDKGDPTREVVYVAVEEGAAIPNIVLRTRPKGSIKIALEPRPEDMKQVRVFVRPLHGLPMSTELRGNVFVFEEAPLGEYEVYAELPTASDVVPVHLTEDGQEVSVELKPPAWGSIAGSVVDGSGAPIIDAWIQASPMDEILVRPQAGQDPPALTDDRGEFLLWGLARGRYHLHVESRGIALESRVVETGASQLVLSMGKPAPPH